MFRFYKNLIEVQYTEILENTPVLNKENRWSTCIYRDCLAWDIPASKQIVLDKSSWKVWKFWSQSVAGVDLILGKHKPSFPLSPSAWLCWMSESDSPNITNQEGEYFVVCISALLSNSDFSKAMEAKWVPKSLTNLGRGESRISQSLFHRIQFYHGVLIGLHRNKSIHGWKNVFGKNL
jgi:hypothetical protein